MRFLIPLLGLALLACGDDPVDDTAAPVDTAESDTDTDADVDSDTDADADSDTDTDPKAIGRDAVPFAMEDINPSSASYGTTLRSEDLAGTPYALVFLDSRCTGCIDVADDLWALMLDKPHWHAALPVFGVESYSAYATVPATVDPMVENNDQPYVVDVEGSSVWAGYGALNHDMLVISDDGVLDAWLPLYSWPDDMVIFTDYMTDRFGD